MKTFSQVISEAAAAKLTHLEHIEDAVFDLGLKGGQEAIRLMRELTNTLEGSSTKSMSIQSKVDGCLHPDTLVCTNKGNITFKELIERHYNGERFQVLSFDEKGKIEEYNNAVNPRVNNNNKEWAKINLENNGSIILTQDHKVFTTNRGWVEAKDLNVDDDIHESVFNK